METKRWSDFVEYIINKKSHELARAFSDLWPLVQLVEFRNLSKHKTLLVAINHRNALSFIRFSTHINHCTFL